MRFELVQATHNDRENYVNGAGIARSFPREITLVVDREAYCALAMCARDALKAAMAAGKGNSAEAIEMTAVSLQILAIGDTVLNKQEGIAAVDAALKVVNS